MHEMGHNWDEESSLWNSFLSLSGWHHDLIPDSGETMSSATGDDWVYRSMSNFYNDNTNRRVAAAGGDSAAPANLSWAAQDPELDPVAPSGRGVTRDGRVVLNERVLRAVTDARRVDLYE